MVYLLKMVIFHGKLLNNQMVNDITSGWWFGTFVSPNIYGIILPIDSLTN